MDIGSLFGGNGGQYGGVPVLWTMLYNILSWDIIKGSLSAVLALALAGLFVSALSSRAR